MKIILDEDAIMPNRAHPQDAGLDLFSRESKYVPPKGSEVFDVGVHIELPKNTVAMVKSKSGLMVKNEITTDGTVDEGYTGSINVKLFNHGSEPYFVEKGDKIAQLVILPVIKPEITISDDICGSERGDSGFGSTGR